MKSRVNSKEVIRKGHFFRQPAIHLFAYIRYFTEAAFTAHARETQPACQH